MRPVVLLRVVASLVAFAVTAFPVAYAQESATETVAPAPPSIPFAGLSGDLERVQGELDEATTRAIELETQIQALEAEQRALTERLAVTGERIRAQRRELEAAEARLDEARTRYRSRLVEVYKRGPINPIAVLLSSDTISEFLSRASVLTRIAEDDGRMVSDLTVSVADARYQATKLDDLLAQDRELQQAQQNRVDAVARALADQEALVAQLTDEAREALLTARRLNAETRSQWQSATIPVGTTIPRATATVAPYAGVTYLVSAYMPREYTSTETSWTAVCSWYGPGFNGRNTASGQVFNEDDFTCASRTLPFGTVLALTRADKRVIVYVNDRGPFIAGRDIDLSKAAAQALGFGGVASVHAEIVVPVSR
jgi:rare lipoprotein A